MFEHINWLAVLAAAVSAFLLGGLWYSKVMFLNPWLRESGTPEQGGHPGKVFGTSFVFALVAAFFFAAMLGRDADMTKGAVTGAIVGGAFVGASFGINYAFAQRSAKMWLIDGGYHTLQFILYGIIIGAMQ
jgi:Protein of unknown function (DUF1761)